MLRYKNIGTVTKTFYGVKFEPGQIRSVPGFINSKSFIRVDANLVTSAESKSGSEKPIKADSTVVSEAPAKDILTDSNHDSKDESSKDQDDKKSKAETSIQAVITAVPAKRGRPAKQDNTSSSLAESASSQEEKTADKDLTTKGESHSDTDSK